MYICNCFVVKLHFQGQQWQQECRVSLDDTVYYLRNKLKLFITSVPKTDCLCWFVYVLEKSLMCWWICVFSQYKQNIGAVIFFTNYKDIRCSIQLIFNYLQHCQSDGTTQYEVTLTLSTNTRVVLDIRMFFLLFFQILKTFKRLGELPMTVDILVVSICWFIVYILLEWPPIKIK